METECKNCEYCDLTENECVLSGEKCYKNGVQLNPNCSEYLHGFWTTNTFLNWREREFYMYIDFTEIKDSAVGNVARTTIVDLLQDFFNEKLNESNVTKTNNGTLSIAVGEKDGNEVCVDVEISVKNFKTRVTPKSGLIKPYDRIEAGRKYLEVLEKRATRAAEKEARKTK